MQLELDKTDLISLVKGTEPYFSIFGNSLLNKCGRYSGSYSRWDWDTTALKELKEIQLYALYLMCKESHK